MPSNKYRAAIIGCGKVAGSEQSPCTRDFIYSHAAGYYHNQSVELIASCDTNQERLERFTEVWGIHRKYTDAMEMLDHEDIDILSIASPTAQHHEHLHFALEKRVPVILCEKPLTETLSQAINVADLLPHSTSKIVVNYFRRFNPGLIQLRNMLLENSLGKTQRITVFYNKGILHNGGHFIDFIRWSFGDFLTVKVLQNHKFDNSLEDLNVDVHCMLEENIPVVFLVADHNNYNILEIDILTDQGRIRLPNTGRMIRLYTAKQDAYFTHLKFLEPIKNRIDNQWNFIFHQITAHLVQIMREGVTPICDFFDGMYSLVVAEAIKQSCIRKETVAVQEILSQIPRKVR